MNSQVTNSSDPAASCFPSLIRCTAISCEHGNDATYHMFDALMPPPLPPCAQMDPETLARYLESGRDPELLESRKQQREANIASIFGYAPISNERFQELRDLCKRGIFTTDGISEEEYREALHLCITNGVSEEQFIELCQLSDSYVAPTSPPRRIADISLDDLISHHWSPNVVPEEQTASFDAISLDDVMPEEPTISIDDLISRPWSPDDGVSPSTRSDWKGGLSLYDLLQECNSDDDDEVRVPWDWPENVPYDRYALRYKSMSACAPATFPWLPVSR